MFNKSILVVAHPDDEVLWFSSIMEDVNEIIICFLEYRSEPEWGEGRRKSLQEYPVSKISCLGIEQSETFGIADWLHPEVSKFGLKIPERCADHKKYEENYYILKDALVERLAGYKNVYTHNPWGEYGHEEHVQIYRVVKDLQGGEKFNLWFSNYCSNNSFNLMLEYVSGFDSDYTTLKTNKTIGKQVKDLYMKNNCWTWYDDWEWFSEESFMEDKGFQSEKKDHGHIFPINNIKFNYPRIPKKTRNTNARAALFRRVVSSLISRAGGGRS